MYKGKKPSLEDILKWLEQRAYEYEAFGDICGYNGVWGHKCQPGEMTAPIRKRIQELETLLNM